MHPVKLQVIQGPDDLRQDEPRRFPVIRIGHDIDNELGITDGAILAIYGILRTDPDGKKHKKIPL